VRWESLSIWNANFTGKNGGVVARSRSGRKPDQPKIAGRYTYTKIDRLADPDRQRWEHNQIRT
jgi:hypothetical protein